MNCGSFFFAEISRTTSSLRPGGVESDSTSETNPYGYARVASSSIVFAVLAIVVSFVRLELSLHPLCLDGDPQSRIYGHE